MPKGFGARERKSHLLDYCGAFRTGVENLPEKFMLDDSQIPDVRDQGSVNSCVGYAATGIMQIMNYLETGKRDRFSAGYFYGKFREEGDEYEGMIVEDALDIWRKTGVCFENDFPYNEEVTKIIDLVNEKPELEETAEVLLRRQQQGEQGHPRRGEKVALVGRNGEGKTTLMRVIMRELEPMAGEARTGHNVNIGYYAQNQEDILDKEDTVFGTLDRIAVGDIRTKLRDILAAFLFKGEDIDKKVAVLSGGERARLAMAKLMLKPYNLLALDEPTNHMDIRSKDILKQALKAYDGTLIVVSHDRDFLDGLVDKLYEFRDGRVKEHLGGVREFLDSRRIENLNELERHIKAETPSKEKDEKKTAAKEEYHSKKFISKEERKIRNRIAYLEKGIGEIESKMKELEAVLASPGEKDDIMELTRSYLEHKRDLDAMTEEWASLVETLDE